MSPRTVIAFASAFCVTGCSFPLPSTRTTTPAALPPATSAMNVSWSAGYLEGGGAFGTGGDLSLTGDSVTTIVRWLNALPRADTSADAGHGAACAYALFYGTAPVFTFHTPAGTEVFAYQDCYQVAVTVSGRPGPPLQAGSAFVAASEKFVREALHVQPPTTTS